MTLYYIGHVDVGKTLVQLGTNGVKMVAKLVDSKLVLSCDQKLNT
jgi:hypothetical protein